ncbi:hypothetical protein FGO68_gene14460 [Halteria grandinella]|uniref:Uncharacterized protein n=1 Tax=Halteria grandinella TaxID=5974 RepID=A0A8J8T1S7_HALGN|nr:hypothetical protein FGO68_gene14460 [Halteria grandinella]
MIYWQTAKSIHSQVIVISPKSSQSGLAIVLAVVESKLNSQSQESYFSPGNIQTDLLHGISNDAQLDVFMLHLQPPQQSKVVFGVSFLKKSLCDQNVT